MSSGRFLEIACANAPSDKLMSFRAGVSELVFEIPEMDSMLVPTSIRMCGKLRCYGAYDKSVGLGATEMNINERLGVYGIHEYDHGSVSSPPNHHRTSEEL